MPLNPCHKVTVVNRQSMPNERPKGAKRISKRVITFTEERMIEVEAKFDKIRGSAGTKKE